MRHHNTRSRMGKLLYGMAAAIITLTGCGGGSGKAPATTASGISNTVSATGSASTSTGSAATAFLSPAEFVYAANVADNTLSQFQIAKNGVLIPLATPTVATGKAPYTMVTASNGHFLYVANAGDRTISQYQVASSGLLTPLTPATVSAGTGSSTFTSTDGAAVDTSFTIVVDAASRFLYAFNSNDQSLRVFAINSDGTLTFKSVVAGITSPTFIAIHPRLPVFYMGNKDSTLLAQFIINADGSLSPMSPATVPAPANSENISVTPNGKFAYVAFSGSASPSLYQLNVDGSLSQLTQPVANVADTLGSIFSIDPGSHFVYTSGLSPIGAQILQFKIQSSGQLAPLSPPAMQVGVLEFGPLYFDPSGQFVYLPDAISAALLTYRIGSDGTLSAISVPAVGTGNGPASTASVQRTGRKRSAMRGRNIIVFAHH